MFRKIPGSEMCDARLPTAQVVSGEEPIDFQSRVAPLSISAAAKRANDARPAMSSPCIRVTQTVWTSLAVLGGIAGYVFAHRIRPDLVVFCAIAVGFFAGYWRASE